VMDSLGAERRSAVDAVAISKATDGDLVGWTESFRSGRTGDGARRKHNGGAASGSWYSAGVTSIADTIRNLCRWTDCASGAESRRSRRSLLRGRSRVGGTGGRYQSVARKLERCAVESVEWAFR